MLPIVSKNEFTDTDLRSSKLTYNALIGALRFIVLIKPFLFRCHVFSESLKFLLSDSGLARDWEVLPQLSINAASKQRRSLSTAPQREAVAPLLSHFDNSTHSCPN